MLLTLLFLINIGSLVHNVKTFRNTRDVKSSQTDRPSTEDLNDTLRHLSQNQIELESIADDLQKGTVRTPETTDDHLKRLETSVNEISETVERTDRGYKALSREQSNLSNTLAHLKTYLENINQKLDTSALASAEHTLETQHHSKETPSENKPRVSPTAVRKNVPETVTGVESGFNKNVENIQNDIDSVNDFIENGESNLWLAAKKNKQSSALLKKLDKQTSQFERKLNHITKDKECLKEELLILGELVSEDPTAIPEEHIQLFEKVYRTVENDMRFVNTLFDRNIEHLQKALAHNADSPTEDRSNSILPKVKTDIKEDMKHYTIRVLGGHKNELNNVFANLKTHMRALAKQRKLNELKQAENKKYTEGILLFSMDDRTEEPRISII